MSLFSYNEITLPYVSTQQFLQEAVYEDVGQTDWYLTKYDIIVQAVICSDYLAAIDPTLLGPDAPTDPAAIMVAIRNQLLRPRRALSFTFNGTQLVPVNNLEGTVDAKNGPMPQHCKIIELNNTTFLIDYRIIAHYWESSTQTLSTVPGPSSAGGNNPVLFNRWTESVELDQMMYTTRRREGTFAIRSDNSAGKVADFFRSQFAVVGVPPGFLRTGSNYTQTPDGLAVRYTVTDKEQYKMPPQPAFKASGSYTESTTRGGVKRFCQVTVKLEGSKTTPQSQLIATAIAVATGKLRINGAGQFSKTTDIKQRSTLDSGRLTVDMYENKVEIELRSQAPPRTTGDGKGRFAGIAGYNYTDLTYTPLSQLSLAAGAGAGSAAAAVPIPGPDYKDRGTAGLLLLAAAYYDPALIGVTLDKTTGQMKQGLAPGEAGLTPEG